MKHILKHEADEEIACFETEDGMMNLFFGSEYVKLSKQQFIEFSIVVHRVGRILIDEAIDAKLARHNVLGLDS